VVSASASTACSCVACTTRARCLWPPDNDPVVGSWEGPAEWQDAHPALVEQDGIAYVTEPATRKIFAVDVETGEILASAELPATPNEIAVVTG
jgi:hypothetical protein